MQGGTGIPESEIDQIKGKQPSQGGRGSQADITGFLSSDLRIFLPQSPAGKGVDQVS